jgi:hypothetical protein
MTVLCSSQADEFDLNWYGILMLRNIGLAKNIKYPSISPGRNVVGDLNS